jgi:AcrR family transcriptional regulator
MSAVERREEVLQAATAAFAEGGYRGTSTEEIAARAGISQPYIFRLFGSKKELFIAVVESCFRRTMETFVEAARGLTGKDALVAMGLAYMELIQDPTLLRVELHAFTASVQDAEVRKATQRGLRKIWVVAAEASGVDNDALREWLATGMLLNVVAATGLDQLDEAWAHDLCPTTDSPLPTPYGREE